MALLSFLHGIDTVEIIDGIRPVTTLKSSVIGLVGTAGKGPLNTPVLITGNQRDATSIFGAYTSDAFSIPKALNAFFKQGGVTVVVINVLDPAANITAGVTESVILNPNTGSVTRGFVNTLTPPTIGTTITAPYVVSSLGANRTSVSGVTGAGTKVKFAVANSTDYQVGEVLTVSGCNVTAYNGATTVTAVDATHVTTNVAFTSTASAATLSPPAKDRVVLPSGATLTSINDITTNAVILNTALTLGQRVKVTYTATTVENTDYTVNYETGAFTRLLTGSKILAGATLSVTYGYINPALVGEATIRGTTDGNGAVTGIEALASAQAILGVRPRLLCAPGWTGNKVDVVTRNAVAVSLAAMAQKLRAITVVSAVNTSKESAVGYASDFFDPRVMVAYPDVNFAKPGVSGQVDPVTLDALIVGMIAATDNAPDGGFWQSPSNRLINGPVSLTRAVDWGLSDTESISNYLNANNVTTVIREGGFRLWGNRMSDGSFITTRRTSDLIEDSIAEAHRWAVDRNVTKGYMANLLANVNAYMGTLEQSGAILGGKAWIDPTINTNAELTAGHIYVDYEFTPPVIAERITFRARIVDTYLTRIFATS